MSASKYEFSPKTVKILDWYHTVEHLWETARALFGEQNDDRCNAWVETSQDSLWDGNIDEVIRLLDDEIKNRGEYQRPLIELRCYYYSIRDRMKHDTCRAKGWFIECGAIENANNCVVNQPLKKSGMKWSKRCANAIIWARCKYYEYNWDEFW